MSLKIAVIGGGIAGVTAAAALLCLDYEVHLFEQEGAVLRLQQGAHHRLVHPSINFWPEERLEWTTEFPFMDWYASNSVEAIRAIERDWKGFKCRYGSHPGIGEKLTKFLDNQVVTGLEAHDGKVDVFVKGSKIDTFDFVFVTAGFGPERNLGDVEQREYWRQDDLDTLSLRSNFAIAVSGTGDGGIIDALRATYHGFMLDEVALKILQLEDTPALQKRIRDIERAAIAILDDRNAMSKYYAEAYKAVAEGLSLRAKALLPSLNPDKLPVTLIGEREAPFDLGVAPIHKLILAHTLSEHRVLYKRGWLRRIGDEWMLEPPGGTASPVSFDLVVVRHGAEAPAALLLGRDASLQMEGMQRLIGDFAVDDTAKIDAQFGNSRIYPERHSPKFISRRHSPGLEFMNSRFGLGLSIRGIADGCHYFQAEYGHSEPKNAENLPEKLFGIKLQAPPSSIIQADTLLDYSR